jgi:hypothetical protein
MSTDEILNHIKKVSPNLRWRDIESLCSNKGFEIKPSKKGYKVYVGSSVWSMHLEHRTSNELKHGIIREFRKVLIKEKII